MWRLGTGGSKIDEPGLAAPIRYRRLCYTRQHLPPPHLRQRLTEHRAIIRRFVLVFLIYGDQLFSSRESDILDEHAVGGDRSCVVSRRPGSVRRVQRGDGAGRSGQGSRDKPRGVLGVVNVGLTRMLTAVAD